MNSENIIGWNFPNVVTFLLMLAVLWAGLGVISHMFRGKQGMNIGASADNSGNVV